MILLTPITLTDAMLTSSSVAEAEATWDVGTTYAAGDIRRYGSDHDLYSSKVSSNTANIPIKWPDETAHWYDEGKTNRWNCFDLETNIQTVDASPVVIVITPGELVTGIHFDSFEADTIQIDVSDGSTTVYTNTLDCKTRDVTTFYDYFFATYRYKSSVAVFDLPAALTSPIITITITNGSGSVKVGGIAFGRHYDLGPASENSQYNRLSFSEFSRDDFGNLRLTQRGGASKATVDVLVNANKLDFVLNLLTSLDASVAVWSALETETESYFRPFNIRGVYRSPLAMSPAREGHAILKFDIEGV